MEVLLPQVLGQATSVCAYVRNRVVHLLSGLVQARREVLGMGLLVRFSASTVDCAALTLTFRSCELKLQEMIDAKEIILRSMDSRKNYQPEHVSWCVLMIIHNADPRTD